MQKHCFVFAEFWLCCVNSIQVADLIFECDDHV